MPSTETCARWDVTAQEWVTVTVTVPDTAPRRKRSGRRTARRAGTPRDMAGLSAGSPLPEWWRDTAYAPAGGFADTRTYIKPATMRTRRAPAVVG